MNQLSPAFFIVGSVLLLTGAITYVTHWPPAPYLFIIGAGFIMLAQINTSFHDNGNRIIKRLRIQQFLSSLLLFAAGIFMFITHGNEWIVCMLIAALLQLYTSFRIPQEEKKEQNKK